MKIIQFSQKSKIQALEWRHNVRVSGVPFTWKTHLGDDEIKELYQALLRERFFIGLPPFKRLKRTMKGGLKASLGLRIQHCQLEYGDLVCRVTQVNDNVIIACRPPEEWECIDASHAAERHRRDREWEGKYGRNKVLDNKCCRLVDKGQRLISHNKYPEAESFLREAVELKLHNPDCRFAFCSPEMSLLQLFHKTKNIDAGIAFLSEIQLRIPHESCSLYNLPLRWVEFGHDFERDGDTDSAERIYVEAMRINPDHGETYKRLCLVYQRSERYDATIAVCQSALQRGLSDGTKGGFEGRMKRIEKRNQCQPKGWIVGLWDSPKKK